MPSVTTDITLSEITWDFSSDLDDRWIKARARSGAGGLAQEGCAAVRASVTGIAPRNNDGSRREARRGLHRGVRRVARVLLHAHVVIVVGRVDPRILELAVAVMRVTGKHHRDRGGACDACDDGRLERGARVGEGAVVVAAVGVALAHVVATDGDALHVLRPLSEIVAQDLDASIGKS